MQKSFNKIFYDHLTNNFDYYQYLYKIKEAVRSLLHCLESNFLIESTDITKSINLLMPRFSKIANLDDIDSIYIEVENLFKYGDEKGLLYLGVLLSSFLQRNDKTFFVKDPHSKYFSFEIGVYNEEDLFSCVNPKYQFFFVLLNSKDGFSNVIFSFWQKHKIIFKTSYISFIPINNNNDVSLFVKKENIQYYYRDLKTNRRVANFFYELLKEDINLVEEINNYISQKTKHKTSVLSPFNDYSYHPYLP